MSKKEQWDLVIKPTKHIFSVDFGEIWRYRDLIRMFVKRDFVSEYKQTILGPIWYLIQPIFISLTYFVILNRMGNMKTDEVPALLFYISGITIWTYFATCLTKTADTFISNARLFGKVYFPRIIVPLSTVLSNLIKFGLQFMLLLLFIGYFHFNNDNFTFQWRWELLLLPLPIILMAGLSLGLGILITSMTTKYRDLKFALTFGVQLLMFGSAVVTSFKKVDPQYAYILKWNPIANVVELFKIIMINHSPMDWFHVYYSLGCMILILTIGILIFNQTEKDFMDTV